MALIFKTDIERGGAWRDAFLEQLPDVELRLWPDVGAPEEIEYAVVWQPPAGFLASLPNLKAVFSIGAGIDHLLADPKLPRGVPIVRMVEKSACLNPCHVSPPTPKARTTVSSAATAAASVGVAMPA